MSLWRQSVSFKIRVAQISYVEIKSSDPLYNLYHDITFSLLQFLFLLNLNLNASNLHPSGTLEPLILYFGFSGLIFLSFQKDFTLIYLRKWVIIYNL